MSGPPKTISTHPSDRHSLQLVHQDETTPYLPRPPVAADCQSTSTSFPGVPSFELESHPEVARLPLHVPLFSEVAEDDDGIFRGANFSRDPTSLWNFSSNGRNNHHRGMLLSSNEPLVGNRQSYSPNSTSLLQRCKTSLLIGYQVLRCWFWRRRQEWQDRSLLQLPSWSGHDNRHYSLKSCFYLGLALWVVLIPILLVGILARLTQV